LQLKAGLLQLKYTYSDEKPSVKTVETYTTSYNIKVV